MFAVGPALKPDLSVITTFSYEYYEYGSKEKHLFVVDSTLYGTIFVERVNRISSSFKTVCKLCWSFSFELKRINHLNREEKKTDIKA